MPVTTRLNWTPEPLRQRLREASKSTLDRLAGDAKGWWDITVPIGETEELKNSWFSYVDDTAGFWIVLVFGASVRYAIYIELGTGRMAPRAPLRTVAGEVFPFIPYYLAEALAA